ncbi:MAG TPA: OpgC domain-containing protein [Bryobacteraceae bacterium]|nr:OpgC domain-containing protein [Bryobacteraceae bacterium]
MGILTGDVGIVTPVAERTATFSVATVKVGKSFARVPQLDTLRGFLLVWMTMTHLPTRVSPYSNQMVGYVSAAEGFILLAAILVGRIQQSAWDKHGAREAREKLFQRVLRIYIYHLALIAFAFSACAAAAVYLQRVPLQNLLDFFLAHPVQALIAAPALVYNPPLLDILPMYVIFMLLTPVVMASARRWGWRWVLLASATIWLLAQFHLREWIYAAVAHRGFPIPLNETGAFDLFGWQFLWIAGLWLGSARAASLFSKLRIPAWLVVAAAAIAVAMFAFRHTDFEGLIGAGAFDALVNKWRLGVFRWIDAAAIAVLLLKYGRPLADSRLGLRLAVLGRASLEVFSAHVLFCLIFLGLATGTEPHFAPWQDAIVIVVTMIGLFVVAERTQQRRAPAPATSLRIPEPLLHRS